MYYVLLMYYNQIERYIFQLTFVPRNNRSRANGKIPNIISTPLLSTKIAAHLCGIPVSNLSIQSSKLSTNQGLPK